MLHDCHLQSIEHLNFFKIEVRCFPLQLAHVLLLRQSKTRCLVLVQSKQNSFFESINLPSWVPLTISHSLDL